MAIPNSNQKRSPTVQRLLAGIACGMTMVTSVHAQNAATDTVWKCWYNQDTRIQCVLLTATASAAANPRYAENAMLPAAVKQLWTSAATLAGKKVYIPLHTEPDDWERVRLLAESVMCGANRACVVDFSRSFVEAALLDPSLDE